MGVLLPQNSTFFVRGKITQNTLTKLLMNKYFGEEVEDPKDGSGFNSRDMHDVLNKTQGRAHSSPSATLCPTVEACARIYVPRTTRYTSCCTGLSRSFPSELLHFLQNKLRELIH